MSSVTATVKGSLMGSPDEPQPGSKQIRSNFFRHARKDEATGDLYMNEEDFVNAIAPSNEDYVSLQCASARQTADVALAQNQTGTVRNPLQRRR